MDLIPRRVNLLFFNSAEDLTPMFHMMMALVIYAAIIYFTTKRGQSPNKENEVAKVDRRVKILKLSLSKMYISNLYMHSYYQIDAASINKTGVSASTENNASRESLENSMTLTLYFASTFYSAMDIIFPKPPIKPPDGLITAFIMIPITWICTLSQLIIACIHIIRHKPKTIRKRCRKRLAEAAARRKPKN